MASVTFRSSEDLMSTYTTDPEVDLRRYLRVLRRRKWWVIVCTGLAVVAAVAYAFTATKEYSAKAQLLVQPQNGTLPSNTPAPTISPTQVATELQLLTSAPVANAVKSQLHLSELNVAGTQQGQTNVIVVTATNPSPVLAARVANAYATEFVNYETSVALKSLTTAEVQLQSQINAIQLELPATSGTPQGVALANQLAVLKEEYAQYQVVSTQTTGGVTVASPASVPKAPSSPKKTEIILLGIVVGLLVGLGAAFTVETLDDAIRSKDDLGRVAPDLPVMALIPVVGSWRDRSKPYLATMAEPTSPVAEAYRSLRTSLQFATYEEEIGSVLVTSPTATEGKTSTVANLGVVLAQVGKQVILVSADLRRPRLATFFGLSETIGLTSVIIGESTLVEALQMIPDIPGLTLLGCGPTPPNPAELLSSSSFTKILDELKENFDMVLIDSSPLIPVTDPVLLSRLADTTLVVVAAGQTTKGQLGRGLERLAQVGSRIGIVFNEVSRAEDDAYGYGYFYTYEAQDNASATPMSNGHANVWQAGGDTATGRRARNAARHQET
jgi:succinoglycan biosynthesis transport protein ExoP